MFLAVLQGFEFATSAQRKRGLNKFFDSIRFCVLALWPSKTIPGAFLQIARGLRQPTLRADYRRRLLALCSDAGLIAEGKSTRLVKFSFESSCREEKLDKLTFSIAVGAARHLLESRIFWRNALPHFNAQVLLYRMGADILGPLLPSVAEICADLDPTVEVEPSVLKLYRNLWFYIALFGLAPSLPKGQLLPSKSGSQGILSHISSGLSQAISSGTSSGFSTGSIPPYGGPYAWNPQWAIAVEQIAEGTPPLVSLGPGLLERWRSISVAWKSFYSSGCHISSLSCSPFMSTAGCRVSKMDRR